jgi:hypothetical protein
MTMAFKDEQVILSDSVGVEDAEALLDWLQKCPHARVDLSHCTHVHPANLQVLMAAGVKVSAWPDDGALSGWLKSVLQSE